MLLVVILGAAFVFALAGRARQRQKRDRYIEDVRAISSAFAGYYRQHKAWPPGSSTDLALPPELVTALKDTHWLKGSPFGGEYGWLAPAPASAAGSGPERKREGRGAVTLQAFAPDFPLSLDRADLLAIDRQVDDGNLATGQFRTGFNGWPVFFVEETKP